MSSTNHCNVGDTSIGREIGREYQLTPEPAVAQRPNALNKTTITHFTLPSTIEWCGEADDIVSRKFEENEF